MQVQATCFSFHRETLRSLPCERFVMQQHLSNPMLLLQL
jgi:hypothetical protein